MCSTTQFAMMIERGDKEKLVSEKNLRSVLHGLVEEGFFKMKTLKI